MVKNSYIVFSMDDERMKSLADVLGNKTCKRIIEYLSERNNASEKDLADGLSLPINTIEYNLKKLIKSGFVQKHKDFFWSKKGKKILTYELSNKSILISPKNSSSEKLKSLVPGFLITLAGSFAIYAYEKINYAGNTSLKASEAFVQSASDISAGAASGVAASPIWIWFLVGGILALVIFAIVNWRKL